MGEEAKKITILDWDLQKKQFIEKDIPLDNLRLLSSTHLILEHFEIHSGMDAEPIRIEDALTSQRIMTLAYHLSKAEMHLMSLSPAYKKNNQNHNARILVRVDAPYAFSPTQYIDENTPLRNTAVTIPPSEFNSQSEIWFGAKWSFPPLSRFSMDRIIDTALCPDSIYHEYIHLFTGNHLGRNTIGRSLSEGISDYFAASLIDYPELYSSKTCPGVSKQIFVRSFHLDTNIGLYDKEIESNFKKDFNFIPGLLWKYRNFVGSELADRSLIRAISKSSPTSRFYPEFINALSQALYEEKKIHSDEKQAKELVFNVEHQIFNPHGLLSELTREETIFAQMPNRIIKYKNQDEKTNEFCGSENVLELLSNDFSIEDPTLRMVWTCNGVKLPLLVNFDENLPVSFQITNPLGYVTGIMKFASLNPELPNPEWSMDQKLIYLQMYKYAKSKYFHYRTKEREMRLYFSKDKLTSQTELKIEFAFPMLTRKGFSYRF
jgi:hypothetical protein